MSKQMKIPNRQEKELEQLSDYDLLTRLIQRRDREAFRVIVYRHGPLVMRVCRSVLRHNHDVEDAYQATFLVLAEKARRIRRRTSLASWLQGTAFRISRRVCRQNRQTQMSTADLDQPMLGDDQIAELLARDQQWILQEELSQLPEKYRAPIVLCYLEGKTREEAACLLSCTVGSVKWRLDKAKRLLRFRLTIRGVTFASLLPVTLISTPQLTATPDWLISATVENAVNYVTDGTIPANLTSLTQGHSLMITSTRYALASSLVAVALLMCILLVATNTPADDALNKTNEIVIPHSVDHPRAVFVALNSAADDSPEAQDQPPSDADAAANARDIVKRYADGQRWMSDFSMHVRTRVQLIGYPDGRPPYHDHKLTILTRGDKLAISGASSLFFKEGGTLLQTDNFQEVLDGKWWLKRETRPTSRHNLVSARRSRRLDYLRTATLFDRGSVGSSLDGHFMGNDGRRIADILLDCPNLKLLRSEHVGGSGCSVIHGESDRGHITAWISCETSLPVKVVMRKGPEHRFKEGIVLKDDKIYSFGNQDLVGFEIEATNIRAVRQGKWWVPTYGEVRMTYRMSEGRDVSALTKVDRTDIVIGPDPSPDDFTILFDDGTRIFDHDHSPPRVYIWRDGEMIPEALHNMEGKPAPNLQVKDWLGEPTSLEQLLGKVVVVDFWGTWCPPCVTQLPKNASLFKKYAAQGLVVVGVHSTRSASFEAMRDAAEVYGVDYPLCIDDDGKSTKLWNVESWPTYFVVDKQGIVRAAGLKHSSLEKTVLELIGSNNGAG